MPLAEAPDGACPITELDLLAAVKPRRRRARIHSEGGSVDMSLWVAHRLPPASPAATSPSAIMGRCTSAGTGPAQHHPRGDPHTTTDQAGLSYRTAAADRRRHSGRWTLPPTAALVADESGREGASAVVLRARRRQGNLRTLSVLHQAGGWELSPGLGLFSSPLGVGDG